MPCLSLRRMSPAFNQLNAKSRKIPRNILTEIISSSEAVFRSSLARTDGNEVEAAINKRIGIDVAGQKTNTACCYAAARAVDHHDGRGGAILKVGSCSNGWATGKWGSES